MQFRFAFQSYSGRTEWKDPSKWDFGRERELARIKKTLKAPA